MFIISFKSFFWNYKKRPAVKIQVKKVWTFYPGTELAPIPFPAALFIFNAKSMFAEYSPESILKCTGFFINNIWQQEPE